MRVWERGSGVTMACGTGDAASAEAVFTCAVHEKGTVIVELDGGILEFAKAENGEFWMKGPAEFVFEAEMEGGETEMTGMNLNYRKVKESYLFADIRRRIEKWQKENMEPRDFIERYCHQLTEEDYV